MCELLVPGPPVTFVPRGLLRLWQGVPTFTHPFPPHLYRGLISQLLRDDAEGLRLCSLLLAHCENHSVSFPEIHAVWLALWSGLGLFLVLCKHPLPLPTLSTAQPSPQWS